MKAQGELMSMRNQYEALLDSYRKAGDFYRLPMEGEKGDMNYESISSCARVRDLNRSISATYRLRERLLKALGKNAAPREGPRAASEQGMNSCGCDHYITGGEST
jgi:hypothetical protein